jgi:hypothetical protein
VTNQPPRKKPADQHASTEQASDALGAVVLHHTVTALMLALIIALGVWAYLTFRKTHFFEPAGTHDDSRLEAFALDAQMQRIRFSLRVYFRFDGRYPAELANLVERGLLLPSDLYYPSGAGRYTYRRNASGYTLELRSEM